MTSLWDACSLRRLLILNNAKSFYLFNRIKQAAFGWLISGVHVSIFFVGRQLGGFVLNKMPEYKLVVVGSNGVVYFLCTVFA